MIWDSTRSVPKRYRNTAFVSGRLTIEFDRTKYNKISGASYGKITFSSRDINVNREQFLFTFPGLDSVYLQQRIITKSSNGSYRVLGHGATSQSVQTENCRKEGLTCSVGLDSTKCPKGKCIRGTVSRSGNKWKFTGAGPTPETYYIFPENGTIKLRHNRTGVSRYSVIYIPPNTYLSDNFVRKPVKSYDSGVDDSKEAFRRKYIVMGSDDVAQEVKNSLSDLPDVWFALAETAIDTARSQNPNSDRDFLHQVYDSLSVLFDKAIQETPSSFKPSRLTEYGQNMARPIYNRLPGISGAYYSDSGDTVSKWLTSGGDENLSDSKDRISNFYYDYLDPDTCYATSLDWLAQHIGLFGVLWDFNWSTEIKRTMIKNAFGWYDREYDGMNHKSKILGEFPFNSHPFWSDVDTSKTYNFSEVGKIRIINNNIVKSNRFVVNSINTTTHTLTLQTAPIITFSKADWNGLIESKGSLLCFAFLVSVFGLKSHDSRELEIIDVQKKLFKVRSGLRDCESDAAPLMPFQLNMIQAGDEVDLDTRNLTNQLVCGVSRACDYEGSRALVFRVPFYYNRGGRSWSKAEYIANAWMPNNINCRVQYGYLACDLWAVGDAFFEPEVVTT